MKGSKDILSSILKTTQMGQIGIRSILKNPLHSELRTELTSQLREYDAIEQEAHGIALSRGWTLKELDPAIKGMTNMMTRSRLSFGNTESKAAKMMIQGNTRGMIKGFKNCHHVRNGNSQILDLSQRLLECEKRNINQMQGYI